MLNHLVLTTLDTEIQRERELITASSADNTTTTEIVRVLENRCRILEVLQRPQSLKVVPNILCSSQSTGNKVSKFYSNVATQLQCSFCNESHRIFKCEQIPNMQSKKRLNHVTKSGYCFNRMQPFTRNHTCSKQGSRQCHKRHHTLLNIERHLHSNNDKRPTTICPPADARGM